MLSNKFVFDTGTNYPLKIVSSQEALNEVEGDFVPYSVNENTVEITKASYDFLVKNIKIYNSQGAEYAPSSVSQPILNQINEELKKYGI